MRATFATARPHTDAVTTYTDSGRPNKGARASVVCSAHRRGFERRRAADSGRDLRRAHHEATRLFILKMDGEADKLDLQTETTSRTCKTFTTAGRCSLDEHQEDLRLHHTYDAFLKVFQPRIKTHNVYGHQARGEDTRRGVGTGLSLPLSRIMQGVGIDLSPEM